MDILQAGRSLLQEYHRRGYSAYFVGGCVRNLLLNLPLADIDICTDARPEETMACFAKVIPTGLKYGTVTVIWEGYPFEVTTFRREDRYAGYRWPERITYAGRLEEDLMRRDFTVNAMAMDAEGGIVDPFNGVQDLQSRLIRAVGNPDERFSEDALRMLRAIRFAAVLDFEIEQGTWQAILNNREKLRHISLERIVQEMDKLFSSRHVGKGIALLHRAALLFRLRAEEMLGCFVPCADLDLQWAILLFCAEPANGIPFRLGDLPLPKRRKKAIRQLLEWHEERPGMNIRELLELTFAFPVELVLAFVRFQGIIRRDPSLAAKEERFLREWNALPAKGAKDLALKGDELAELLGREPGPWVRETLFRLWKRVNFCGLPNRKEQLQDDLANRKG